MNGRIIKKSIDDLRVWSDNPRYGYLTQQLVDERIAINTLIDVVGENKMFALARDIVESGGLFENTLPTVVNEGGSFLVYDGNRRISTIKMLFDPSIIDNGSFKTRIVSLIDGKDISALRDINVLLTDRENAIRLMDGTHSGERGGAGMIPWGAYERDVSLSARGKNPQYSAAFGVAKLLGWNRRADFSPINYTDLDRLFSSKALKDKFGIKCFDESERASVDEAITALKNYKICKKFKSYSREFNTTAEDEESLTPISNFILWYEQTKKAESTISISLDSLELFEGDPAPDVMQHLHIQRRKDRQSVKPDPKQLIVEYTHASGKTFKALDTSLAGNWTCRVTYLGVSQEGIIKVKTIGEPCVEFNSLDVPYGSSFDLKTAVKVAVSSRGSLMKISKICYVGGKTIAPSVVGDVLTGESQPGSYPFAFWFDDAGKPLSLVRNINVIQEEGLVSSFSSSDSVPFKNVMGIGQPVKLRNINDLIHQINEAWKNKWYDLAVCGMRTVLELTILELSRSNSLPFQNANDLSQKVQLFKDYLLDTNNRVLKNITTQKCRGVSYHNERNFLNSLDCVAFVSKYHLGAHQSAVSANLDTIFEACKDLSHLIQLADLYLR